MQRATTRRQKATAGFTLLEVLIALTVLATVISVSASGHPDADVSWGAGEADAAVEALRAQLARTLSRSSAPRLMSAGQVGFQLTRGELGVSL